MNSTDINTNVLTLTAITALKSAYEECTEKSVKESIITAFKAVIQLRHDLGKQNISDKTSENDNDYDASEYCAAV